MENENDTTNSNGRATK